MKTTTISTALVAIAISLAASACGTSSSTGTADAMPTPSTTTNAVERPSQLVDRMVRIDSGRMHVRCIGSGDSTVLLIAGWGNGGDSWGAVEPAVAERARVCSYARFGTGTSDAPSTTQTFGTQAADLHTLLEATGEPGPYVVLGHSFGGAEAVAFASRYADEVVGLMLLDATPVTWPATACSVVDDGSEAAQNMKTACVVMHDPTLDPERLDAFASFDEVAAISSLDDLPMTVMSAAHRTLPGLAQSEVTRLEAVWAEGVDRWAGLSSASSVLSVEDTGHHIELDKPDLVIAELLQLLP